MFPVPPKQLSGCLLQWHSAIFTRETGSHWVWLFSGNWASSRNQPSLEYFTGTSAWNSEACLHTLYLLDVEHELYMELIANGCGSGLLGVTSNHSPRQNNIHPSGFRLMLLHLGNGVTCIHTCIHACTWHCTVKRDWLFSLGNGYPGCMVYFSTKSGGNNEETTLVVHYNYQTKTWNQGNHSVVKTTNLLLQCACISAHRYELQGWAVMTSELGLYWDELKNKPYTAGVHALCMCVYACLCPSARWTNNCTVCMCLIWGHLMLRKIMWY